MVSGGELGDWRITPTTDWESPAFQAIAVAELVNSLQAYEIAILFWGYG